MKGMIFDIKEFSIHDGPGIRTTVFFKGCPLRCIWCHNPEGLSIEPELMIKHTLCDGCNKCKQKCSHKKCEPFDRCVFACHKGLVNISGVEIESMDLAEKLKKYADFLNINGGGITFSGGEPLMQADFLVELLEHLNGIHTAIQTSGYADQETFKRVIDKVDYIMLDIKIADGKLHKKYTGVDNELILKNLEYLKSSNKPYIIRVPLISDITDTSENLSAISNLVGNSEIEYLPYNTFAGAKYPMVGREFLLSRTKV